MMCAKELAAVKKASEMEWEKEKVESLIRIAKASIEFCENKIGPDLEKKALDPRFNNIVVSYFLAATEDKYGNEVLCPVCFDGVEYANGTRSRKADTSVCYSQTIIEQYLKDHCLTVEWIDETYLRYWWGARPAKRLYVSLK